MPPPARALDLAVCGCTTLGVEAGPPGPGTVDMGTCELRRTSCGGAVAGVIVSMERQGPREWRTLWLAGWLVSYATLCTVRVMDEGVLVKIRSICPVLSCLSARMVWRLSCLETRSMLDTGRHNELRPPHPWPRASPRPSSSAGAGKEASVNGATRSTQSNTLK
mmetsp:Transcript_33265/g.63874  ORF Transcript_33265/g.63874 Transcript_33265/m.63874 type:complete len:164 (-) Transcript_33265:790-1281(-)